MQHLPELVLAGILTSWYLYQRRARAKSLGDAPYVPGPKASSFWAGNLYEISATLNGQALVDYAKQFGGVLKLHGTPVSECDTLLISDTAALGRIIQASNRAWDQLVGHQALSVGLFGASLASVGEEDHARQRRGLQPAFNAIPIKALLPEIELIVERCIKTIDRELGATGQPVEIDAMSTFKRWAIDSLSVALFSTPLNTLEDPSHPLVHSFSNLLEDGFTSPNAFGFFIRELVLKMPHSVVGWLSKRDPKKMESLHETIQNAATFQKLVDESVAAQDEDSLRDQSLPKLLKAVTSPDSKYTMTADELFGNIRLLLFAGHDTSATTMANICRMVAPNPAWQARLTQEVKAHATHLAATGAELTVQDLETLPLLNATIQETLRLLPILPAVHREAYADDVLPLSRPLQTTDGRTVSQLAVGKGQHVLLNFIAFNRDPDVWGADADYFNPERWLWEGDAKVPRVKSPGIYRGLMSFGAGSRGCIGFRFAILELQAMMYHFFQHFRVSPVLGIEIETVNRAVSLPRVKGRFKKGGEVPVLMERL